MCRPGTYVLEPYITYARLSLMNEKERENYKTESDIQRRLDIYETVDAYLKNKQWHAVIETIELSKIMATTDLQLLARFTHAYLHQDYIQGEMRFVCKIIVLANYCEQYNNVSFRRNQVLPHYIEMWAEERLDQTARQASKWLEDGNPL